jgi:hypothetical protein
MAVSTVRAPVGWNAAVELQDMSMYSGSHPDVEGDVLVE